MTFDNDFIQFRTTSGIKRILCKDAGVEWPPPLRINHSGFIYERVSYSRLTDAQREGMDFLMRGADYALVGADNMAASAHLN